MFSFLKNHQFSVEAQFDTSLVLTFAVLKEDIEHLIPECLELDVLNEKWAFIAVAMVETKKLRPKGFPKILGNDFFLIGYRVFVRYKNNEGKSLRGLYIIKSETNKKKMELLGNFFTHYNYSTTDIQKSFNNSNTIIKSIKSNFKIEFQTKDDRVELPQNSPFKDWKEARKFAGPLPFTFTYNKNLKKVLIIEGVRQNWTPTPLKVIDYNFTFLNSLNIKSIILANAFIINNIPYYWKKGKIENWKS